MSNSGQPNPLRTFEECYSEITVIVEKQRSKWTFKASVMRDFDDIKSEIITHVWKKWPLYDQSRPLGGWVATIVKHQFANILRDTYTSTSSPCSRCVANKGDKMCSLYGEQGVECPLYKKWYHTKRHAHEAKLPVSIEERLNEIHAKPDSMVDLERAGRNLHIAMEKELTGSEWEIYRRLYVEHKSEEDTAKELGFKTTEQGRKMGYKRIRQVKTIIIKKAKKVLSENRLEIL